MKKFALAALALVALMSMSAFAQSSSNATATASAKIVSGIAVTKTADLKFGDVVRSAIAGTVTLDAATSARTANGGVTLGLADGAHAAAFTVTGEPTYTFAISMPSSISLVKYGSSATLSVSNFTSTLAGNAGTITANGDANFTVGADLNVGANQETGVYQGDFTVTAAYN